MRFLIIILVILFQISFSYAEEQSFKLSFGSNLGNVPFEINKMSKNIKKSPGIEINSWILSPNFSSFLGNKKSLNFSQNKYAKEKDSLYIKFNFKF